MTTACNGLAGGNTVPTYILSVDKCTADSAGLVYTAESVVPTVASVEVQQASNLAFIAATAATGVYGSTQIKHHVFSEPVELASVLPGLIFTGNTGTLTASASGNIVTISGARFTSGVPAGLGIPKRPGFGRKRTSGRGDREHHD